MDREVSVWEVARPATLWEALGLLEEGANAGEPWVPMVVGRGLEAWCQAQGIELARVLDLGGIQGPAGISESEGEVHLGGLTSLQELRRSPVIRLHCPVLGWAAGWQGGPGRPVEATVCGPVVDGLPTGILVAALSVFEPELTLISAAGLRGVGWEEFYQGQDAGLWPDELLLKVNVPKPPSSAVQGFVCRGHRGPAGEAQVVGAAVCAWLEEGDSGALEALRVALVGVGADAEPGRRLEELEASAKGRRVDGALLQEVVSALGSAPWPRGTGQASICSVSRAVLGVLRRLGSFS